MAYRELHPRLNLLDTSVSTDNLGDLIIVDSIKKQLSFLLDNLYVTNVSTHDNVGDYGRTLIDNAPLNLLLGTNILTSKYKVNRRDTWRVNKQDLAVLASKVLLCGVGWRNYQLGVRRRQKAFYNKVLHSGLLHSVRDSQTETMLKSIGIDNVINTSCPTLWGLTKDHCQQIPNKKSDNVVFVLTAHKGNDNDKKLIDCLLANYQNVSFWPQQIEDTGYLKSIVSPAVFEQIQIISPSLTAYDHHLQNNDTDFVGTRLHGGIRALQHKRRALIIAIDNRATEIGKDTNLPVVAQDDLNSVDQLINSEIQFDIKLPLDNINKWKAQLAAFYKERTD